MASKIESGTSPLLSAQIGNHDKPGKYFYGSQTWMLGTKEETNGSIGLFEQLGKPGTKSPYHIHEREDEMFFILDGQMRFVCDGASTTVGSGSWVFLPRNVPHGFELVGDKPIHFLFQVTPGGFEGLIQDVWTDSPPEGHGSPEYIAKVQATALEYGIRLLGPLPD